MWLAVVLGLGLGWMFYKYWVSIYRYWEKRGIPFYPGRFPFGSHPNLVTLKEFQGYTIEKIYFEKAAHPLFGIFLVRKPMAIIRNPEIIRLILNKEFFHFKERHVFPLTKYEVLNHNLINLEGERWGALRMKLTPAFSSGKMKAMFPLIVNCAEVFSSLLLSKLDSKVHVKELTSRYAADVICSCAFGLDMDIINRPDNKLREIAIKSHQFKFPKILKMALIRNFPKISTFLSTRLITSVEDENYVINLVSNIIELREKNGSQRNDFIDLLRELKNKGSIGEEMKSESKQPIEVTLEIMAAQCFMFIIAGFETSSSAQTFLLYELALHQDIQSRVFEEIKTKTEKHGGITYEAIQEMQYLDMVISETLRKYPTLAVLIRKCTKSFTTPTGHSIEAGINVLIPVWALHYDPQYFPNPDKFDPERFSEENKGSIVPYTYLPFGEGPRKCIGMRFGRLQTKVGLVTLLRKFQVEPCEETKIPLEMGGCSATTAPKDPIILKLVARPEI